MMAGGAFLAGLTGLAGFGHSRRFYHGGSRFLANSGLPRFGELLSLGKKKARSKKGSKVKGKVSGIRNGSEGVSKASGTFGVVSDAATRNNNDLEDTRYLIGDEDRVFSDASKSGFGEGQARKKHHGDGVEDEDLDFVENLIRTNSQRDLKKILEEKIESKLCDTERKRFERDLQKVNKMKDMVIREYDQDSIYRDSMWKPVNKWMAKYSDPMGEETVLIESDGNNMQCKIRGVRFKSQDLIMWKPLDEISTSFILDNRFELHIPKYKTSPMHTSSNVDYQREILNNFQLITTVPTTLISNCSDDQNRETDVSIVIKTELSGEKSKMFLELQFKDDTRTIKAETHGFDLPTQKAVHFNKLMTGIHSQLPKNVYIRMCWGCAFSEYPPLGSSTFGHMGCFKSWPQIKKTRSPADTLQSWNKVSQIVQETHHCPSYEIRPSPRYD